MRSKRKKTGKNNKSKQLRKFIGAILVACAVTAAAILIYAFVLKFEWLPESSISFVNTLIKAAGALIAGIIAARSMERVRWWKSGLAGVGYIVFSYLVCMCMEKNWRISAGVLADVGMGLIIASAAALLLFTNKKEKQG